MRYFIFGFLLITCSLYADDQWYQYKAKTMEKMSHISGWCSNEKAHILMDIVRDHQCKKCIEIGVFCGKSLFPIARALKRSTMGKVYGIDAWNFSDATKGLNKEDVSWYSNLDFNELHQQTKNMINKYELKKHCKLIRKTAKTAVNDFEDGTIDFIHFDGNPSEEYITEDVLAYFPKLKDRGLIFLNNPNSEKIQAVLVYLLERTEMVSEFSRNAKYLLLRKSNHRIENAQKLMKGL